MDRAPTPASYCAGKSISAGCTPPIGSIGTPSATAGRPSSITASDELPGKRGLPVVGFGPSELHFQGGFLCLEFPVQRLGAQDSGRSAACSDSFLSDMGACIASGSHPLLAAGAQVCCPWWNRDPLDPTSFGSALSNALVFGIAP